MESYKYFKKMRAERGLTQEEVSRFLGYSSKQIVSNWERGTCMPPLNKLAQLVKLLEMDKEIVMDIFLNETQVLLEGHLREKSRRTKKRA